MNSKTTNIVLITTIILLLTSLLFITATKATRQTTKTIDFSGSIIQLPQYPRVDITIDSNSIIGTNNFSTGFMIDFEWKKWSDSPTLRQLTEDANFKLIRIFDWRSQTGASPDPCISWNDATKTGTFDWTTLDLLIERIFQTGAEPLITLGGYAMETRYLPNGIASNPQTGLPPI